MLFRSLSVFLIFEIDFINFLDIAYSAMIGLKARIEFLSESIHIHYIFFAKEPSMLSSANYDTQIKPILLLDFDLNGTLILQDSSKGASWESMLISALAENIFDQWEEALSEKMSFKKYAYNVLLPGDKSDQQLKKKRAQFISNFFGWLTEHNHPARERVLADYDAIKTKFSNPKTNQIQPSVFPSFYLMLKKLRSLQIPFVLKLRTFGNDLREVSEEIKSHPDGVAFTQRGKFSAKKLHLDGEGVITKVGEIFQKFLTSKEHFALQDDWKAWNSDGERARSGKPFIYSGIENAADAPNLALFFDDNFTGEEQDIIDPIEINGKQVPGKMLKDKMLFRVNTIEAMKDDDYYINLIHKALLQYTASSLH